MRSIRPGPLPPALASFALVVMLVMLVLVTILPTKTHAEEASGPSVYQQRNADGSVVLTDRPSAGAVTQRTWRLTPPDPRDDMRREAARQDAAEVTRRIGQRMEADDRRAQELTLARVRAAEVQARIDADAADAQPVWVVGTRFGRGPGIGWNTGPVSNTPLNSRPATVNIVRGVPLRADGFPVR